MSSIQIHNYISPYPLKIDTCFNVKDHNRIHICHRYNYWVGSVPESLLIIAVFVFICTMVRQPLD